MPLAALCQRLFLKLSPSLAGAWENRKIGDNLLDHYGSFTLLFARLVITCFTSQGHCASW
jgi:hypothetical protein